MKIGSTACDVRTRLACAVGPPPFEVLAGPEPEVEVGVEMRSLALGDGKARSVHVALVGAGGEDGGVGFDVCCRWVA